MSLQAAAQHLASRGRGPDTTLVHMAPQEVAGLQALAKAAGGTLTVNPETGLAEAGFLKNLLPTLIGVGLTAATGGAAAPWMIGLGLGGFETLRTGSLEKGLMAGLGAYGGAGLAGGLLGAGAGAAQQAAVAGAGQGASQAAVNQAAAEATKQALAAPVSTMGAGIQSLGTEAGRSAALSSMGGGMGAARYGLAAAGPAMMDSMAQQAPYAGSGPNPYEYDYDPTNQRYTRVPPGSRARDTLTPMSGFAMGGPVQDMSQQNEQLTLIANDGRQFAEGGQISLQGTVNLNQPGSNSGGQFGQSGANGYQAAGGGMGGFDPRAVAANPQGFAQYMSQMQQREAQMPGTTMLGNGNMMAGMGGSAANGFMSMPGMGGQLGGPLGLPAGFFGGQAARPSYEQYLAGRGPLQQDVQMTREQYYGPQTSAPPQSYFAEGGLSSMAAGGASHLGDYSDGGRLLKGPGDGVSDSIPATIADKRPARLADGEFVVPARIVSELGNGSTEAGARKLYAMMDRIQKARGKTTGKNRVAVDSRAEKALPA